MYLISVYFDEKTENRIKKLISEVAEQSGNTFMVDNNVPPHMTISAFETLHEEEIISALNSIMMNLRKERIEWVTVGTFPTVIFIQPVLNEYLHNMSSAIYESIASVPNTKISNYYRTFQWLPHATIGKQLSEDEMRKAFDVLQKSFSMFEGDVVKIELAKKKPFKVIANWVLK